METNRNSLFDPEIFDSAFGEDLPGELQGAYGFGKFMKAMRGIAAATKDGEFIYIRRDPNEERYEVRRKRVPSTYPASSDDQILGSGSTLWFALQGTTRWMEENGYTSG